jgi:ribosome biogenesis GTPase
MYSFISIECILGNDMRRSDKPLKDDSKMIGRVVELHGQRAKLFTENGTIDAVVKGKLKYGSTGVSPVAVGDFVKYSLKTDKLAAIESVSQRQSVISKPATEKEGLLQIMVSNVDRLIVVTSTRDPKFTAGLVDRFLVTAFKEQIEPVVVLNKIDLKSPEEFEKYFDAWRRISCKTVFTSVKTGEGIDKLEEIMKKGTSAITGHSGVGKTSLLNRISPELNLKTEKVSSYSSRGVHTTSRISLYQLFPDGWVADTPGLKVFGLAGVDRKTLQLYFPEFEQVTSQCQFNDCVHMDEPSCAIKHSVEIGDGVVAEFRYQSYLRICASLKQ